jgi:hypothetical protein
VSGANATSVVLQHVPVALEKLLGVVAACEIVSAPVPAANCAAVPVTAVIVVFAGMPLPTMTCPVLGGVEKETFETVVDPVVVVAPRLVNVMMAEVFVDVALADIVSCCVAVLIDLTYALAGIPVPEIPMPTTMLLRLAVVPLMLVIVAEPFDVFPAMLKVID